MTERERAEQLWQKLTRLEAAHDAQDIYIAREYVDLIVAFAREERARGMELEEALAFIRDYLDTCAEPPELRGQNECTRRRAKHALEGKKEHGTKSND